MGGIHERPVYRTELPIKGGGGAWTICKFNGGGGARQGRGGEVNTPTQTMWWYCKVAAMKQISGLLNW